MRISDWSSDVCSSDLPVPLPREWIKLEGVRGPLKRGVEPIEHPPRRAGRASGVGLGRVEARDTAIEIGACGNQLARRRRHPGNGVAIRSEEHTSELQSLMRISYSVFCLKNKNNL